MKRNFFIIIGIFIAILVMMCLSNVIIVCEKIGEIFQCVYVEYALYVVLFGIFLYFVVWPSWKIFRIKPLPALSVEDETNKESIRALGNQLGSHFGYIANRDSRKARKKEFLYELNHAYELEELRACVIKEVQNRMEGNAELDVKGITFYIKETAKTVFMVTAVSPNSKVDAFSTLVLNFTMMKDMILATGFRPNAIQMWGLYVRILATSLLSYVVSEGLRGAGSIRPFSSLDGLEVDAPSTEAIDADTLMDDSTDVDIDVASDVDFNTESFSFANILSRLRIPGAAVGPILDGLSNAMLTLRIGYVTRSYLLEGRDLLRNREKSREVKQQALMNSLRDIPSVLVEGSKCLGKTAQKVAQKLASKMS